jgi:hypothetical protein
MLAVLKYLYGAYNMFRKKNFTYPIHISVMFHLYSSEKYFSLFLRILWNNSYNLIRMNINDSLPIKPIKVYT